MRAWSHDKSDSNLFNNISTPPTKRSNTRLSSLQMAGDDKNSTIVRDVHTYLLNTMFYLLWQIGSSRLRQINHN